MVKGVVAGAALSLLAALVVPVAASAAPVATEDVVTRTFGLTGSAQHFTVPAGVCSVTVDLYGAAGGDATDPVSGLPGPGGLGGRATADLVVVPGETLTVLVGGRGEDGQRGGATSEGGFGGGADGDQAGGGGGSSVRRHGTVLIAAGGGGGSLANFASAPDVAGGVTPGGPGGGLKGGFGINGGTQTEGGSVLFGGAAGAAGAGGQPSGGGGFFGGGGGGFIPRADGSGTAVPPGGGSGTGPPGRTTFETGVRSGNGQVTIAYDPTSGCPGTTTETFGYTGAEQAFVVPAGVCGVSIEVSGAQGGPASQRDGNGHPGAGGWAQAEFDVTAGERLTVLVGGAGEAMRFGSGAPPTGAGGYGGGGDGAVLAGGGGGLSLVRRGSQTLLVAGGGGGASSSSFLDGDGGGGGGSTGEDGASSAGGGRGGTQVAGGAGGTGSPGATGEDGTALAGGDGVFSGGGGGGGWFGGGGGGDGGGPGGGGSGYGPPGAVFGTGVGSGHGEVAIAYRAEPSCPSGGPTDPLDPDPPGARPPTPTAVTPRFTG